MKLKVAIVVPGRFHAFDLARALIARGQDVTVFTNYPASAVARFGFPAARVRSFVTHGVLMRLLGRLPTRGPIRMPEAWLHQLFGRWAARELGREFWDVVHTWSGVSEEVLRAHGGHWGMTLLMRGSAHITAHARLLQDEERRAGVAIDQPSSWMRSREVREYRMADTVLALSTFAGRTFLDEGFPAHKLNVVPLGVNTAAFRPGPDVVAERQRRMRSGAPLRVLYVGALSYQKGMLDLSTAIHALAGTGRFQFRLVGAAMPETARLIADLRGKADVVGKVPQRELPAIYHDSDIFVFPTIQDGYAAVLAQAKASGLPIIATTNCAGPDLITPDEDGWVVPIRDPQAIIERLRQADASRDRLAEMSRRVYDAYRPRDWAEVAEEFEQVYERLVGIYEPVRIHA
jgi:glycosyltransferase involved in cell wall biosynthesis